MKLSFSSTLLLLSIAISVFSVTSIDESSRGGAEEENVRRVMMSFQETPNGGNVTFECSPSGPCVPCAYSEKSDAKFRCSETGYRIPFKCEEIRARSEEAKGKKVKKNQSTLEDTDSSTSGNDSQAYITYRSCITKVSEERLSVLGFEGVMLGMLMVSGSAIYYKRKRANPVPGGAPVRVPNSSRF